MGKPANAVGSQYAPQQFEATGQGFAQCRDAIIPVNALPATEVASHILASTPDLLASGDRIRLKVAGDEERLSRVYVLAANGMITLDGRLTIQLAGKPIVEAERTISQRLLSEGLVRGLKNSVRVQLLELG
ncbi:MAG: polysaccharide biosynthesis/export family protein, partial [Parasphingorhabdus sp.]